MRVTDLPSLSGIRTKTAWHRERIAVTSRTIPCQVALSCMHNGNETVTRSFLTRTPPPTWVGWKIRALSSIRKKNWAKINTGLLLYFSFPLSFLPPSCFYRANKCYFFPLTRNENGKPWVMFIVMLHLSVVNNCFICLFFRIRVVSSQVSFLEDKSMN